MFGRKDFLAIREDLLKKLLLHNGELMAISNDIHKEHSLAISKEEAAGLAALHEMVDRLGFETRTATEKLRSEINSEIRDSKKRTLFRRIK